MHKANEHLKNLIQKDFEGWHKVKVNLDDFEKSIATFKEREIWWCSIGMNIGYEIYGKKQMFTRPVLILRKYNKFTFFGVPLSSKRKESFFRYPFDLKGVQGDVILDQGRTWDVRRLADRMGKMPQNKFEDIKKAFKNSL